MITLSVYFRGSLLLCNFLESVSVYNLVMFENFCIIIIYIIIYYIFLQSIISVVRVETWQSAPEWVGKWAENQADELMWNAWLVPFSSLTRAKSVCCVTAMVGMVPLKINFLWLRMQKYLKTAGLDFFWCSVYRVVSVAVLNMDGEYWYHTGLAHCSGINLYHLWLYGSTKAPLPPPGGESLKLHLLPLSLPNVWADEMSWLMFTEKLCSETKCTYLLLSVHQHLHSTVSRS